jgi:hypothetical protein
MIFAEIDVIWCPLSTSDFGGFGIRLQSFGTLILGPFDRLLLYFNRRAAVASRGWLNQSTALAKTPRLQADLRKALFEKTGVLSDVEMVKQ